jgi:lipopolysaccharide/colanic/teichoic acid biosynthesis glycosyltransferase
LYRPVGGTLADLVERYPVDEALPSPQWLEDNHLTLPLPTLSGLNPVAAFVKRAFDIVLALGLLILLAPVMALVALLVLCTSRGPAVFKQVRVGLNMRALVPERRQMVDFRPTEDPERRGGPAERRTIPAYGKPFVLYKFRTMCVDAEKDGASFAVHGDPRITPVGKFLRRTRLDEVPQLLNVVRGEMSLVGPRPERPEFIEELSEEIPGYLGRLRLKPGLTGLAQVLNGYDNNIESFRKKIALDLLYLQNHSTLADLKILVQTIGVVLTGKGAL